MERQQIFEPMHAGPDALNGGIATMLSAPWFPGFDQTTRTELADAWIRGCAEGFRRSRELRANAQPVDEPEVEPFGVVRGYVVQGDSGRAPRVR